MVDVQIANGGWNTRLELDLVYQVINDSERKSKLLLTKFYSNQYPLSTVFFLTTEIAFVFSSWIINEFDKYFRV